MRTRTHHLPHQPTKQTNIKLTQMNLAIWYMNLASVKNLEFGITELQLVGGFAMIGMANIFTRKKVKEKES